MLDILLNFATYIPFYVYALLLTFAGCYFYRKTSSFSFTAELTEHDNPAFGIGLAGYLIGLATAIAAAFPSGAESLADALISMTYSGVAAILLMRLSLFINERFILKYGITEEMLRDRNIGTGLAVAGGSIGTGFVLAGALTGESAGYLLAIRDIVIYWALGQLLFILGAKLFFKTAGYDLLKSLEHHDNPASGASLAGFLVSLGILLAAILKYSSSSILEEVSITVVEVVIGGALLLLTRFLTERLIIPKVNLADEISVQKNCAAGVICGVASILTAILLAAAVTAH
jgi:uncharacterized membrane protein YjfL (UPF0719 family)